VILPAVSAADTAYDRIKDAILSLQYRPGEKLSEVRLATHLGVGRSPLRTALARLASEGWLRVLPQSGTFVSELSTDDVLELAQIRLLLEPYTARLAATRITAEEVDRLQGHAAALKSKGLNGRFGEFAELDDRIHSAIHRAAGNARIADILRNLHDQIHWVRVSTATLPGRVEQSMREMDAILRALKRRDGAGAQRAMRRHIDNIAQSFRKMPGTPRARRGRHSQEAS
jgi:DNA-binding GntR family transcriptional regulator